MSTGRPRASSRETIAEAACELFLEQGYERTSIAEIAARAGVSRSSFFNYFASKGDVLWSGLDERIDALEAALDPDPSPYPGGADAADRQDADDTVLRAIEALADGFAPDSLALAIVNASQMGIADELEREAAVRHARIARSVSRRLRAEATSALTADVIAAALAGATLGAISEWARQGAGRTPLTAVHAHALAVAAPLLALRHPRAPA